MSERLLVKFCIEKSKLEEVEKMEKKRMRKVIVFWIFFVLLGGMVVITVPENVSADTITVPDDYSTIQGAINAADPGDTIYVKKGTYGECININENDITLDGQSKANTKIDGQAKSSNVVTISADNVVIKDFTIFNADPPDYCGIYSKGSESDKITGCRISNCEIKHNYRGIRLEWTDNFEIDNNIIHDSSDCGILLKNSYNFDPGIHGNTIYDTGPIHLYSSYFKDGIHMKESDHNTIKKNTIYDSDRDGIHMDKCDDNDIIDQNYIYENDKDGICIYDSNSNKIYDQNSICLNKRHGIYMYDSDNNIIGDKSYTANCIWDNNNNDNDDGDGIFLDSNCNSNLIEKCHIFNSLNYDETEIEGKQQYGIRICDSKLNTIQDCKSGNNIEYNRKDGIYVDSWYEIDSIAIMDNCILGNKKKGIYMRDSASCWIQDNLIEDNEDAGVNLTDSNTYNIVSNDIRYNKNGIELYYSDNIDIVNYNYIIDNGEIGVKLDNSDDNYIFNNFITATGATQPYGISLQYSKGNIIEENNISGTKDGLFLYNCGSMSNSNTIKNNEISIAIGAYGCHAIDIQCSINTVLIGNKMIKWGVWIEGFTPNHWTQQHIDDPFNNPGDPTTWNQINPNQDPLHYNPVYYFTPSDNGKTFDGDPSISDPIPPEEHPGEIILAGCDDITVQNFYQLPGPPTGEETMEGSTVGILLGFATNCNVYTNHIHEMQDAGIYLFDSNNNDIEHNKITSTSYEVVRNGIKLVYNSNYPRGVGGSDNNDIESNYIERVEWYGIKIDESCINNNIFNNILIDNNYFRNQGETRGKTGLIAQAFDANPAGTNSWFKSYPSNRNNVGIRDKSSSDFPNCGNYWSDWVPGSYDYYYGINQNIDGSDSIIDLGPNKPGGGNGKDPYVIDPPRTSPVQDDYPFNSYGLRSGGTLELYWDWPDWDWE